MRKESEESPAFGSVLAMDLTTDYRSVYSKVSTDILKTIFIFSRDLYFHFQEEKAKRRSREESYKKRAVLEESLA